MYVYMDFGVLLTLPSELCCASHSCFSIQCRCAVWNSVKCAAGFQDKNIRQKHQAFKTRNICPAGRPNASPATQNASRKSSGDKDEGCLCL